MGMTNFPDGVNAGSLEIAGVPVTDVTLGLDGITANATEVNMVDGLTTTDDILTTPTAAGPRLASGVGTVTGATLDVVTGLATVVTVVAGLGEDPGATAGDVFGVSAAPHATPGTITISIWQDDATAATEDTTVNWIAIGT